MPGGQQCLHNMPTYEVGAAKNQNLHVPIMHRSISDGWPTSAGLLHDYSVQPRRFCRLCYANEQIQTHADLPETERLTRCTTSMARLHLLFNICNFRSNNDHLDRNEIIEIINSLDISKKGVLNPNITINVINENYTLKTIFKSIPGYDSLAILSIIAKMIIQIKIRKPKMDISELFLYGMNDDKEKKRKKNGTFIKTCQVHRRVLC